MDPQGIALTSEQIAKIVDEPKLKKRRRSGSIAAENHPVTAVNSLFPATLFTQTESATFSGGAEPESRSGMRDGIEAGAGDLRLDTGAFPSRFATPVEDWTKKLKEDGKSNSTIGRRALSAIRQYFDWAEAAGHVLGNPAKASMIKPARVADGSTHPRDSPGSLTPDDADALIDALTERASERHLCTALIASLASNEGLELREILSLRRNAIIDPDHGIASAIVVNGQDIELSSRTRQLITRYASHDLVQSDGSLIRASSLGARSGSLFRQTVGGHLRAYGQAVGFPRVNLRELRTSCVRRLVRTGLDYEVVRRRARLSQIDQVARAFHRDVRAQG